MPQYKEQYPISVSMIDPVMRAFVKYRIHPCIIASKENCNSSTPFDFSSVHNENILKEIENL